MNHLFEICLIHGNIVAYAKGHHPLDLSDGYLHHIQSEEGAGTVVSKTPIELPEIIEGIQFTGMDLAPDDFVRNYPMEDLEALVSCDLIEEVYPFTQDKARNGYEFLSKETIYDIMSA